MAFGFHNNATIPDSSSEHQGRNL